MRIFSGFKSILLVTLLVYTFLYSCREDAITSGCTDYKAINYNSLATEEDGSCQYLDSVQKVLINGEPGFWGLYQHSGGINLTACYGEIGTKTFSSDSVNNEVKALYLKKDSANKIGLTAVVVNHVNGLDFKHGYLTFKARLPQNSMAKVVDLKISGPYCKNVNKHCVNTCLSTPIQLSVQTLSDTAFQQVVIPISQFETAKLNSMDNVFSIFDSVPGGNDTVIYIKDINWRTYYNMSQENFE